MTRRRRAGPTVGIALLALCWQATGVAELRPSRASLNRQNRSARAHDYTFLKTPADVTRFVRAGYLVPVHNGEHHVLRGVSYPYARPEVKLFIRRLGHQYHRACGEVLVVTSLVRPTTRQPRNGSRRSVHPTGMALDLRRSRDPDCRAWLERTLSLLEDRGILEATRERRPPHYHVALFPRQYSTYLARRGVAALNSTRSHRVVAGENLWTIARRYDLSTAALRRMNGLPDDTIRPGQVLVLTPPRTHRVASGETLWQIARDHDTTVADLKETNRLRSNLVRPGQELALP